MLNLQGDLRVHDPVMIRQGDMYYVFCTGGSINRGDGFIPILCSDDMIHWNRCGHVFETMPEWALQEIPGTQGIWAPDISYFNGEYHIYYSISTFGKNNSAIGLATNKTLDPTSPDYHWDDHGMVLRSTTDVTDWNAIDPNLVLDGDKAWLCWGSFWSGIKMRRIDRISGKPSVEDTTLYSLASRPRSGEPQTPPVVGAIEAPFIIKHAESWYLFVSFDFCCRGKNSTYKIMVGRSENITGPYIDNAGMMMINGGGTLVLAASEGGRWVGPGHCAVVQEPSGDYLVFHAYDSQSERSLSELKISTIDWEDGWPQVGVLP
ncbi:family 43 glycosylhydrolase [candidate division KSB1 bacterium]|nr:family 43 glycosylhydrolase [candidate division KSB1 bacterium]